MSNPNAYCFMNVIVQAISEYKLTEVIELKLFNDDTRKKLAQAFIQVMKEISVCLPINRANQTHGLNVGILEIDAI